MYSKYSGRGISTHRTHYETLGVAPTATPGEIRTAFCALTKKLHPDVSDADAPNRDRFASVKDAYDTLRYEDKRRTYDASLVASTSRAYEHPMKNAAYTTTQDIPRNYQHWDDFSRRRAERWEKERVHFHDWNSTSKNRQTWTTSTDREALHLAMAIGRGGRAVVLNMFIVFMFLAAVLSNMKVRPESHLRNSIKHRLTGRL